MRRRISWLVAATTSAVILAFVIPLCLLVRTLAEDRAMADGDQEARSMAVLVTAAKDNPALGQLVAQTDQRAAASTSVLTPDGTILGHPHADLAEDLGVLEAAGGEAFTDRDEQGGEIFVPVVTDSETWVVVTTVPVSVMRSGVYRAWLSIASLGVLLLVAALVVADRIGRRVSVPITELATVAQRLHEGDLDARAEPSGPEETVELAETLNRLAGRIVELLAAERAAVGDLSHRLRTPVTALRLDAESLSDDAAAARMQDHIQQLQRTIDAIVRDARRPLHSELSVGCDATAVVAERAAFWSALAEDQGRPMDVAVPDRPVRVGVDRTDLTDMLDVLVDNVFAHTPEDTPFSLRLREAPRSVLLEVADSGPGLADAGDAAGRPRPGTSGLGLQIVRRTAARVGGRLSIEQKADGLVARVELPRASPG